VELLRLFEGVSDDSNEVREFTIRLRYDSVSYLSVERVRDGCDIETSTTHHLNTKVIEPRGTSLEWSILVASGSIGPAHSQLIDISDALRRPRPQSRKLTSSTRRSKTLRFPSYHSTSLRKLLHKTLPHTLQHERSKRRTAKFLSPSKKALAKF
jgi:hypothetical protein